jgi:molybdopterin converting factor subunit 1
MDEMKVCVRYFALFREAAGKDSETVETSARTASELYRELAERNGFKLPERSVRVAIGEQFVEMDSPLSDDEAVVFIPPVAGG